MVNAIKKDKIIAILEETPNMPTAKIAKLVGASTRHVRDVRSQIGCPYKSQAKIITVAERKELSRLRELEQGIKAQKIRRKVIEHMWGKRMKLGIISDTHSGSIFDNSIIEQGLYKAFKREGVEAVYHAGDWVEGERVYRGQEYERYITGGDRLIDHVVEIYPDVGLKTFGIAGNHDNSYWNIAGIEIVKLIAERRDDIEYLGKDVADIKLAKNVIMRLYHPDGGTAYALSYKVQKYVSSLSGGEKPNILIVGHYHKAEMIPQYRNVCIIQAGTTMSQSDFMKRKALAAHIGGWILDIRVDRKQLISEFTAKFISFYELAK